MSEPTLRLFMLLAPVTSLACFRGPSAPLPAGAAKTIATPRVALPELPLAAPKLAMMESTGSPVELCVLDTDGWLHCRIESDNVEPPPEGRFVDIAAGTYGYCGLRPDGRVECWGTAGAVDELAPPDGEFVQVDGNGFLFSGLRADGPVERWGSSGAMSWGTNIALLMHVSAGLDAKGHLFTPFDDAGLFEGAFTDYDSQMSKRAGLRSDGTITLWYLDHLEQIPGPWIEPTFGGNTLHALTEDRTVKRYVNGSWVDAALPGGVVDLAGTRNGICALYDDLNPRCIDPEGEPWLVASGVTRSSNPDADIGAQPAAAEPPLELYPGTLYHRRAGKLITAAPPTPVTEPVRNDQTTQTILGPITVRTTMAASPGQTTPIYVLLLTPDAAGGSPPIWLEPDPVRQVFLGSHATSHAAADGGGATDMVHGKYLNKPSMDWSYVAGTGLASGIRFCARSVIAGPDLVLAAVGIDQAQTCAGTPAVAGFLDSLTIP